VTKDAAGATCTCTEGEEFTYADADKKKADLKADRKLPATWKETCLKDDKTACTPVWKGLDKLELEACTAYYGCKTDRDATSKLTVKLAAAADNSK
jgi:hypothetical protein